MLISTVCVHFELFISTTHRRSNRWHASGTFLSSLLTRIFPCIYTEVAYLLCPVFYNKPLFQCPTVLRNNK